MKTNHVEAYFKAISNKAPTRLAGHLSESIVLLGPVFPEPSKGKTRSSRSSLVCLKR
jgi:hypothetical protein